MSRLCRKLMDRFDGCAQQPAGSFSRRKTARSPAGPMRRVNRGGVYGVGVGGSRQTMNMAFELKATRLADIALQEASLNIWDTKYRLKTKSGEPVDRDIDGTYERVAKALAAVEEPRQARRVVRASSSGRCSAVRFRPAASRRTPAPSTTSPRPRRSTARCRARSATRCTTSSTRCTRPASR